MYNLYYWTKYITAVNSEFPMGQLFTMFVELSLAKLEEKASGFCSDL